MTSRTDRNCLSWWLPQIRKAGLPVPPTLIVRAGTDLSVLLDGETPEGWTEFLERLTAAARLIGFPCFLRTGHGSGKHDWEETCYVRVPEDLRRRVGALVEWSHLTEFMGLPTEVWAVRRLIPTCPLFTAFRGMPITREFRVFIRGDEVEHVQPYWPPDSIEGPSRADWRERLVKASELTAAEGFRLAYLAGWASGAVGGGYWSVDLLQAEDGAWWLTDMAEGDRSFRWEPV